MDFGGYIIITFFVEHILYCTRFEYHCTCIHNLRPTGGVVGLERGNFYFLIFKKCFMKK